MVSGQYHKQETGPEETGPEETGPEETGPEETGHEVISKLCTQKKFCSSSYQECSVLLDARSHLGQSKLFLMSYLLNYVQVSSSTPGESQKPVYN